jgi:hypothetical protein
MHVSLDDVPMEIPPAATLGELLEGIAPQIEPGRLVTQVEVNGSPADASDPALAARWRLAGGEAITIRTEAPAEFAAARRQQIAIHLRRIGDLLAAVADGFTAGDTMGANRGLAGAARELGLVLELDRRLVALDRAPSRCEGIAETVRRVGPRLEAAEQARRWHDVATLLVEELVPALRAVSASG